MDFAIMSIPDVLMKIIDPKKSRDILSASLKISLNKEIEDTKFGIFRM